MLRRYLLFSLVSLLGVAGLVLPIFSYYYSPGLPFQTKRTPAGELAVMPLPGIALPPGLNAGDVFAWQAMTPEARAVVDTVPGGGQALKAGVTYPLMVRRGISRLTVPVTTVPLTGIHTSNDNLMFTMIDDALLLVLGLLTLWRGSNWVAWGLSLFAISFLLVHVDYECIQGTPYVDLTGLLLWDGLIRPLAFFGLYVTAESLAGSVLGGKLRWIFRIVLAILLGTLVTLALGRTIGTVFLGWPVADWFTAMVACFVTLIFLSIAVLVAGYVRSPAAARLRLRWILAANLLLVVTIILRTFTNFDLTLLGRLALNLLVALAYAGYVYGVLRHRLVDLSFVIDRTLVYGATTSVVVGVLAAVNALAQHAALGQNTSLLLQVVVPLALGIVLGTVRKRIDAWVERVFFRRKYKADKALRNFAQHCAFIEQEAPLLDRAVMELKQQTGTPGVAFYERSPTGYRCLRQLGQGTYPKSLETDDPILVSLRAGLTDADLFESGSALGQDGYAFPMVVRGVLLGVVVVAPRPAEQYTGEDRKLLALVVHEVGVALFAARARSQAEFLRESVNDRTLPEDWRVRARELVFVV